MRGELQVDSFALASEVGVNNPTPPVSLPKSKEAWSYYTITHSYSFVVYLRLPRTHFFIKIRSAGSLKNSVGTIMKAILQSTRHYYQQEKVFFFFLSCQRSVPSFRVKVHNIERFLCCLSNRYMRRSTMRFGLRELLL